MTEVVVVGSGVFGSSIAYWGAGLGWNVTLVEAAAAGHPRAASGGESRIYRCAHGSNALYTQMARRAGALWRELEIESGQHLLQQSGAAWFARRSDGFEAESEAMLQSLDIPVERIDGGEMFPTFSGTDLDFVLFEPEAGALFADRATIALANQAQARGARRVYGRARPDGRSVLVDGPNGAPATRLEGDVVVWACGGWLPSMFAFLPMRVSRQWSTFFDTPPEWDVARRPVWIDYEAPVYGIGSVGGRGLKVCLDVDGLDTHPDSPHEPPPIDVARATRDYLGARFPGISERSVNSTTVCQYALTPDTNFIAAPHPEHPSVWLVGGDSGHGFKHGPAFAERLAPMLTGQAAAEPAWSLGAREVGRGLRTAGHA